MHLFQFHLGSVSETVFSTALNTNQTNQIKSIPQELTGIFTEIISSQHSSINQATSQLFPVSFASHFQSVIQLHTFPFLFKMYALAVLLEPWAISILESISQPVSCLYKFLFLSLRYVVAVLLEPWSGSTRRCDTMPRNFSKECRHIKTRCFMSGSLASESMWEFMFRFTSTVFVTRGLCLIRNFYDFFRQVLSDEVYEVTVTLNKSTAL